VRRLPELVAELPPVALQELQGRPELVG